MQRRHLTLGLTVALLGLNARADDDGEFVILHARYGTEYTHVDVTERLRDLARQDRRFRLTNELFGVDPDPGRTKTLKIFARDRFGQERQFEYRERDWVDGAQFIGWGRGNWGEPGDRGWHGDRGRRGGEGHDDGEFTIQYATYGTGRREVDVTDRLRELARRDVRFRLGNDTFGGIDPDPGQTKTLRIMARDRAGQPRTFEYREYQVVDGNQFIGWGRGDWGGGWGAGADRGPVRPPAAPLGRLFIESASYGADGRWVDVTPALRALARSDRLDMEVRNDVFDFDPAPGQRKTLSVTYRYGNEPSNTARVSERDRLRLP